MLRLPPGPPQGRVAQTVMLTRDPRRTLERLRARYGPVFTVRSTNGPMVVVGAADELTRVTELDPGSARAGEARRRVLPQASPRSGFGGDGESHRAASARVHDALTPPAVAQLEPDIAAIAARHVASWPVRRATSSARRGTRRCRRPARGRGSWAPAWPACSSAATPGSPT